MISSDMSTPGQNVSPLVTPGELADLLMQQTPPVILDVRYPGPGSEVDGHAQYVAGHVPTAVFLPFDGVLSGRCIPGVTGRHPFPEPETFQAGMRAVGVSASRPVVVYDDWKSIAAARAWWMLCWAGHKNVRVLDGGWRAWVGSGAPVSEEDTVVAPGDFTVSPGGRTLMDADGAARLAQHAILIDARPADRFRGQGETIDPVAGHIPGAASLPALDLVTDQGHFLPASELITRFVALGVLGDTEVGIYCGSGIQACHVALAAQICGICDDPAIYMGSWSEWITDPRRPIERG